MAGSCSNTGCTAEATQYCAGCKIAIYCSRSCQKKEWPAHKGVCNKLKPADDSAKIHCVRIFCPGDGGLRYADATAPRDHPMFSIPPVPISQKIGFPLIVQRPSPHPPRGQASNNQHATWLMIDPTSGFAPSEWQGGIGTVIVARADMEPLDTSTLGAITDYVSDILDAFGDGLGRAQKYYNRQKLDEFIVDHLKMQQDFQAQQKKLQASGGPFG